MLNLDLQSLIEDCEGLITFFKEGTNLKVSRNKLTDNETLMLWLFAWNVGFQLGILKKDSASKEEL